MCVHVDQVDVKPLVTISMSSYNQEKYVREAVLGLLAQDYEPLEILISDDCSKDRTWEIIKEVVAEYLNSGGAHRNIILNRNDVNLGIAKHSEKIGNLAHGEIRVGCGGDDISLPNRVSRIVKAFVADKDVTCVISGLIPIDENSNEIKGVDYSWVSEDYPLGAAMAYRAGLSRKFPPIEFKDAFEDGILVRRARMLGKVVKIQDKLVKYRLVGVHSSQTLPWLKKRAVVAKGTRLSIIQALKDLEYYKPFLEEGKHQELLRSFVRLERMYKYEYDSVSKSFFLRFLPRFNYHRIRGCGMLKAFAKSVLFVLIKSRHG